MLEQITERLAASISDRLQRVIPLAELLVKGDLIMPAVYQSDGQFTTINQDNYAGLAYFRQDGNVSGQKVETRGCNNVHEFEYPVRLVACVQKKVLAKDDAYSNDALALLLIKDMAGAGNALRTDLQARKTEIRFRGYSTNQKDILTEEYSGLTIYAIPFQYALVGIDLVVTIEISTDCMENICKNYCYAND